MSDAGVRGRFRAVLATELGSVCDATSDQLDRLASHYELMLRWNQRLNLTRVVDVLDAVRKHYCEAAIIASMLPAGPLRVADVGSGAGFPGLPVAILRPDLTVTLIESHQRKSVFLREASRGLGNVDVVSDRAESLPGGSFGWVISRAVRFEDVLGARLSPNVMLLLSETDGASVVRVSGFDWKVARPQVGGATLCIVVGTPSSRHVVP